MTLHFEEQQKFTQWWIWVLLIGITLIPMYALFHQIVLDKPLGNNPMSTPGLVIFLILMLALDAFFISMRLNTKIDNHSITMVFAPLTKKNIPWSEIATAEVVNYGFVGGWGIRFTSKYGPVYNIKGKMGLFLTLKDGTKLCIGTQKTEELKKLLEEAKRQRLMD